MLGLLNWTLIFVAVFVRGVFGCFCPHVWDPVCGTDDQLYSNFCFFMCAKLNNKDLMPQIMSACSQPTTNQAAGEEGTPVIDTPPGDPSAVAGSSGPPRDPTFDSVPHYDGGYSSSLGGTRISFDNNYGQNDFIYGQGQMPVCNWSCRKTPTHTPMHVCDELNGVYPNDCEFYKAVCRAEYRGFLLRRVPCKRSQVTPSIRRKTWL